MLYVMLSNLGPIHLSMSCEFSRVRHTPEVVPYTFVRRGVPVREDTYPEPTSCEVG